MHLIAFFFIAIFVILLILLIGVAVVSAVVRSLFGGLVRPFGKKKQTSGSTSQRYSSSENENNASYQDDPQPSKPKKREKIFDENDGEYIDFEEIKE